MSKNAHRLRWVIYPERAKFEVVPCSALAEIKIPLPNSFVLWPTEYTCQFLSILALGFWDVDTARMDGTDIWLVSQVISGEMTNHRAQQLQNISFQLSRNKDQYFATKNVKYGWTPKYKQRNSAQMYAVKLLYQLHIDSSAQSISMNNATVVCSCYHGLIRFGHRELVAYVAVLVRDLILLNCSEYHPGHSSGLQQL